MGTPAYMSPERRRLEVDKRTDIWGSAVPVRMLSGRKPFEARPQRPDGAVLRANQLDLSRMKPCEVLTLLPGC